MSITKETMIDQITVVETGVVMYREVTKIFEDGKELTKTYHRTTLFPGQTLTNEPSKVVDICNVVWTDEVIAAFETQKTQQVAS